MPDHSDIDHSGLTGVSGSVATDAIFDAKGDLPVGTGANTAAKLTAGTNGYRLEAASGETTGLLWVPPPQFARHVRSAGDYTTSSTSFVDVDATNFALTITTRAKPVMVGFVGSGYSNNVAGAMSLTVAVDGTDQGDATTGLIHVHQHATASEQNNLSFTYLTDVLTAASHTFKLRFRATNAAHVATISGGQPNATFWVAELA